MVMSVVCYAGWAHSAENDKQQEPVVAEDSYIWLWSHNAEQPFEKLHVHPVSGEAVDIIDSARSAGFFPSEQRHTGDENQKEPVLRTTGDRETLKLSPADAPFRYDISVPGAERKTRTFTGPGEDAAPMILLIDERRNDEEALYFGILSVNIKW